MNNLACHHIDLQGACGWCDRDHQQRIERCDECLRIIISDSVYLAPGLQLLCVGCYVRSIGGVR